MHAVYYAPKTPNYSGPTGDKPPCLVHVHGGPESLTVVPVEQAQDMYELAGVSADIQVYKREGHHIGEADHIKDAVRREKDCYERALKLKGVAAV